MTDMLTRCPACETSFRLKPAHLNSAKGAVRCGSCLHIFIARDHLLTRVAKKPEPTQLIESIYREALEANPPVFNPSGLDEAQTSQFEENTSPIPEWSSIDPYQNTEVEPEPESEPELAAEQGFDSEPDPEPRFDPELGFEPEPGPPRDPEFRFEHEPEAKPEFGFESTSPELPNTPKEPDSDDWAPTWDSSTNSEDSEEGDESWAINLLEELGQDDDALSEQSPTENKHDQAHSKPELEPDPALETEHNEPEFEPDELNLESQEANWVDTIDAPPLDIETANQKPQQTRQTLWVTLSLLAALGLLGQFAQMNFEHYSRIEPWRGLYAKVCELGICTLPSTSDTRKIKAYNLVVRTHPEENKALIVDAIILNTAEFSQPFPKLELRFNDVANKVIAARQFQPSEYLAGELLGQTEMPKQQPVQLSLEIVDPGPEAMGYSIHISE